MRQRERIHGILMLHFFTILRQIYNYKNDLCFAISLKNSLLENNIIEINQQYRLEKDQ